MTIVGNVFSFFLEIFRSTSVLGHYFRLSVQFAKTSGQQKFSCSIFWRAKDIAYTGKIGFSVMAQITKLIWFTFSKTFSRLLRWAFKILSKKFSFCCHFTVYGGNLHFLKTTNALLMTISCRSVLINSHYVITIWYSHLYVLIFELIRNKSLLNQRRKFKVSELKNQRLTALNQRKTELISSEMELISAAKRQNSETALFNADYLRGWLSQEANFELELHNFQTVPGEQMKFRHGYCPFCLFFVCNSSLVYSWYLSWYIAIPFCVLFVPIQLIFFVQTFKYFSNLRSTHLIHDWYSPSSSGFIHLKLNA